MYFILLFLSIITLSHQSNDEDRNNLNAPHLKAPTAIDSEELAEFWLVRLMVNLAGYATIFVPAALLVRHLKKIDYFKQPGRQSSSICFKFLNLCIEGSSSHAPVSHKRVVALTGDTDDTLLNVSLPTTVALEKETAAANRFVKLMICFFGLQSAYLTWGVLQEKIMTKDYISHDGRAERFRDSQFLVFMNRVSAFMLAGVYLSVSRQPRHHAPLYKYSFASFSNIMSSWCQYEALKFVSFPTQVLAKACKVIPVMLMGKVVSKQTYQYHEYVSAVMISVGMTLFLLSRTDVGHSEHTVTTLSGVIILSGYMLFDSFTANWQGELFKIYSMSSVQMMCGVNFFSCVMTSVSLLEQGSFFAAIQFATRHFAFLWDVAIVSVCSAIGQMFIFYTIGQFGAVTFVIIMTVRQGFAILLSCLIYGHSVHLYGVFGIFVVFGAIFLRMYCSERTRRAKRGGATTT